MPKEPLNPDSGKITKRFVAGMVGIAIIFWCVWRAYKWKWAYFSSLMAFPGATAQDLAGVSIQFSKSDTTLLLFALGFICAIVCFMITGSVAVMKAALGRFSSNTSAKDEAQAVNQNLTEQITRIEGVIDEGTDGAPERRPFSPFPDEP